ncbi:metallophosphoesterase family protein [Thermodesulfobacteriota bacterium]
MKIGLIADTHIPQAGKELTHHVAEAFEDVDLILHAGDLIVLSVLDWLEKIAPVVAVRGNGDARAPDDPRIHECRVITAAEKRIGMRHCIEFPSEPEWNNLGDFMERRFEGPVDVILFGDTHVAFNEIHHGVLLINPGSPSFPRDLVGCLGTVGVLDITNSGIEARIVTLR